MMDNHNTMVYELNTETILDHNGFSYFRNGRKIFSLSMTTIRVLNLVMSLAGMALVFTGSLGGFIGVVFGIISLFSTIVISTVLKSGNRKTESNSTFHRS